MAQDTPPPLRPLPQIPAEDAEPAAAREVAPPNVVASAVAAVARLGDEVVLARYQVALDRMNPEWKKRAAERMGGMDKLEEALGGVAKQMMQQGVSIISFKPQGAPRSFEVGPGRKVETVNGEQVESLVFSKWLVMIPTVTQFRVLERIEGQAPKYHNIESIGFQVAISDKDKDDWTFIDGAGLSVPDLRSVFGTLPADIKFPPVEKRAAR